MIELPKNCFKCKYSTVAEIDNRVYCSKHKVMTLSGRGKMCPDFKYNKWGELQNLGKSWAEIVSKEVE